jgi:hypothetical protein
MALLDNSIDDPVCRFAGLSWSVDVIHLIVLIKAPLILDVEHATAGGM